MKKILIVVFVALLISVPATAGAGQLGTQIPSNCVAHVSFDGGPDLRDDYRCAGIAIEFHTAGVAFSPGPIWAGQWLFRDEAGQFRVGSCTFNRGIHPTIDAPSAIVQQQFPNDPTGAKGAYLTWRYGDTTENLTAAAMWAVFHYYAQDAAGSRRATNAEAPLIPSLEMVARASGRTDIQERAIELDAEAAAFAAEWVMAATIDVTGQISVTVFAGAQPVLGARVSLLMSGQDSPVIVNTDETGTAHATMPASTGPMTIVASTSAPGGAFVYRGVPAGPDPQGAQRLVTGGQPRVLSTTASIDVPVPPDTTTTTTATTVTVPETTTSTTSRVPETSTTSTTTTVAATTTTPSSTTPSTTTTTVPAAVETAPTTVPPQPTEQTIPVELVLPPVPGAALPRTGKASDVISYLGTSLLVAGIGIVGVAGRKPARRSIYTR
ncbi:MAG TPA: hypothetical protein VFE86_09120 [Ilumatobacteraceae bacterium]|nr:hypothetical protein [Ilumatobacteraceae bacterium]